MLTTTSEVYRKGSKEPFNEEDDCVMGPTSHSRWSYATSKAIDEFLGLAYYHQFGLPVVVMRFFNTVGPRQTGPYCMVLPRFVRQALAGEPITIYGDGEQSRCFADVADIIDATIKLAFHPGAVGQVFNVGASEEVTIRQLAEKLVALTGSHSEIVYVPYDEAYAPGFEDMRRRVPDLGKVHQLIGYEPHFTLEDTLKRVIEYERQRKQKQKN